REDAGDRGVPAEHVDGPLAPDPRKRAAELVHRQVAALADPLHERTDLVLVREHRPYRPGLSPFDPQHDVPGGVPGGTAELLEPAQQIVVDRALDAARRVQADELGEGAEDRLVRRVHRGHQPTPGPGFTFPHPCRYWRRMPSRPQVARALLSALVLAALAVAGTGCLGRGPAALRPPHCAPAATGAQPPDEADAGPIAVDYLTALADHRYDRAQGYAHACSTAQQHSLDQLWLWLDSMPVQAIKVADAHVASAGDGVTVQATLFAKFGPKPYSAWVTLGPKTLR